MPHTLVLLITSFKIMWSKKTRWPLILFPIIFGVIIYTSFFFLAYDFVGSTLQPWLVNAFDLEKFGTIVSWTLLAITTLLGFFLMNWTFVLVVSLFAAPFNEFLSESIAHELEGESSLRKPFWSNLLPFIWNEAKKICFIGVLSVLAFALGFIPFLLPVTLWISFLLIAMQFTDYSWVRDQLGMKDCAGNVFKRIWPYTFSGALFFILINIPIINLLVPAWATSHFTVLYVQNKKKPQQIK